ncbi:MAG: hypothetical protein HXY50_01935, partial [Ignavibacteriaceae bacterium]|nr:hypothetical protein [Ignavibacteriaceae bacterium]
MGGDLGKFLVAEDKINVLNIRKEEFVFVLHRIRNNIQTDFDLDMLNDLAGEMMGPIKLNGEFAIIHPDFHNKPKGQTITFRINPAEAKDKYGNQLTFSQIYNVINNAISAWNSVSCSYTVFNLSSTPYSGSRINGDGISTISFELWESNGGGDPPSLYSEINEYDIIFNKLLRWNTDNTYPINYDTYSAPPWDPYLTHPSIGPVDLQDVATHEFGHAVGLANLDKLSIYDYTMRITNYDIDDWWEKTSRRNLSTGDKAGKIYMDPDFSTTLTQPV